MELRQRFARGAAKQRRQMRIMLFEIIGNRPGIVDLVLAIDQLRPEAAVLTPREDEWIFRNKDYTNSFYMVVGGEVMVATSVMAASQ